MAAHNDPFRHTCLVPYVDAATAPPDVAAKINVLPFRRNVFLVLAHARGPFPHLMSLLGTFFNGQLRTVQLLEWQLIVLRTANTLGSKYVHDVNLPVAELYELGQDKLDALRWGTAAGVRGGEGPWTARERAILRVVDEQLATYTNEPATIAEALQLLSVEELVECIVIVGTYALLARVNRGLRVDDDQPIRPPGMFEGLRKSVTPTVPRQ
ncbi:putative mitochondrial enoyl reductase protein [Neofusicoccum parvum UCRNP2]|uniref:Putative mitochondrial enoyl reductase protein n=1 Tax=Botryosphaeria parva (strain UCR-NP2) TaxID=1287680 RepID=R1EQW3_BOTPV|nr:putative mitochondrial enoyl reductase protein [Neofusicoccum parvum UCRNP2]